MADLNATATILENDDTLAGSFVLSATDDGFPHTVGFPSFPITIRGVVNGATGVAGTLSAKVVPTTALFKTYVVAIADAGTTPAQSLATVQDPSGFTVNGGADFLDPTREATQVMAISGNVLTVKPKLAVTHPKGSVALVPGGMKGYQLPANGRIGNVAFALTITPTINAYYTPFSPHIDAKVVITSSIVGYTPPIQRSGSIVTTINSIKAIATGTTMKPVYGSINASITISAALSSSSAPMSGTINTGFFGTGALDFDGTIISMFGLGYTLIGTIALPVPIAMQITGSVEPSGTIAAPITITSDIEMTADAVNSIYDLITIGCVGYVINGTNTGTVNDTIVIAASARGQAVGTANTVYGSLNKPVAITIKTMTGNVPNTGYVPSPLKLGIIPGSTKAVSGIDQAVFSPILGTAFLSPGVPVPKDFFFGTIGATPVASLTVTVGGSTGDIRINVDGADIMDTVPSANSDLVLAANIANAINEYTGDEAYTASVNNADVTIYAPAGSGSSANGLVVSFFSSGNRTLNLIYGGGQGGIVGVLDGGADGTVIISSDASGYQYSDGTVVGAIDGSTSIEIDASLSGSVLGNGGTINSTVIITGALSNGFYGINIAKINVQGVVGTSGAAMTIAKATANAHLINTPSAQHVAKAVAYAVIGPDATSGSDDYQAIFFF